MDKTAGETTSEHARISDAIRSARLVLYPNRHPTGAPLEDVVVDEALVEVGKHVAEYGVALLLDLFGTVRGDVLSKLRGEVGM